MNLNVTIDWKFFVALGSAVGIVFFASKIDGDAVERVLIHGIDACKELAVTVSSDR